MVYSKILNFWNSFTNKSTNRKILGAAVTVGLMTVLVNFASISKQLIIAWKFGTGDDIDAFLIALLVPSLLVNVVGGSFNAAFIPTYIQVKQQEGDRAAQKLFSGVTAWSSLLLLGATIAVVIAAPYYLTLLGIGFTPEKLNLTFRLLCTLSPSIILRGTITIWSAILNAGERFALAALTPSITPLLTILLLLAIPSLKIYAIAVGLVVGSFLEIVALGTALNKQGILVVPKFYSFDNNLKQVATQYIPMVAGAFLLSSTNLVDKSMAAMLFPGSVAALDYGSRVIALPLGLATKALSTAVVPYFSKIVTLKDWRQIKYTLKKYLLFIFLLCMPLTALSIVFSHDIIEILFQRGAFTPQDTEVISKIHSFYALQLPFYVGGVFLVRLVSAFKCNHVLMYSATISVVLNIFGNYALMLRMGITGIALSTSIVYIASFVFVFVFVYKKVRLES